MFKFIIRHCFLPLSLFIAVSVSAQKKGKAKIDSILQKLPGLQQDTIRLKAYDALARDYIFLQNDLYLQQKVSKGYIDTLNQALPYIAKQLQLAIALKKTNDIAYSYVNRGEYYTRQKKYSEALDWYAKAAGLPITKIATDFLLNNTIPPFVWYVNHDAMLAGKEAEKEVLFSKAIKLFQGKDPRYLALFKSGKDKIKEVTNHDQLMKQVRAMPYDSNKVNVFNERVIEMDGFWSVKSDSAKIVNSFAEIKALSKKIGYKKGVYYTVMSLGNYYYAVCHDHVKALDLLQEGAALAAENGDLVSEGSALETTGSIYHVLEYEDKALYYMQKSLKTFRKFGEPESIGWALNSLASAYASLDKFDISAKYQEEAWMIAEKLKNDALKSKVGGNLAWSYYNQKKYLQAYKFNRLAIKADSTNQSGGIWTKLNTLGCIYRDAPDADLLKMGIDPKQRNQKALECFERSQSGRVDNPDDPGVNLKDLGDMYGRLKQYEKAYFANKEYILKFDKRVSKDKANAVLQRQYREDYNKKEQALTNKQQQQRNYFIIGITVLVLVSFFITRNYVIQRRLHKLVMIEKQRSDDLLTNILPANVAEELKQKGSANARLFNEVTVLFTDFVNFTTISELLSPQQLVDELNYCFSAFDNIMAVHGIEKIKTIGDAYLAVSGLPNANVDHALNAMNAALEIQQFIKTRKAELGDHTFGIRIGIHSGSVVAGIVGVKKFAYDIWGDTVNTAARMEQNSEPGKINVSGETYELVKDQFIFTYRGEIAAKNKGALKMYFVEGAKGEN